MRTWGGRFSGETDARVADFTRSIEIDAALAADDIAGSIAHVRGLGRAGLLTDDEVDDARPRPPRPRRGRRRPGAVEWDPALEDVHMNLEAALAERVGPLAGRAPHRPFAQRPGRHGPAALDAPGDRRPRREHRRLRAGAGRARRARRRRPSCPGTTHIQPAQPVLFAHHLLAYVEMAERDRGRLADARRRVNVSPLGAGALAGAGYPLDREATARELGLRRRHAPTRSTPSRTATSSSRCWRPSRSGWSTSAGWPRRSRGGRTRGSGSCASPTRSRPAAR